ncbi:MAG: response regulator, partial [Bdellovibrionota bacterium]
FKIKAGAGKSAKFVNKESLTIKTIQSEEENKELVLKGLNVLVVEDSQDNQMLIDIYLQNLGAQINSAYDGREGVESALKNSYDVVLMDVQMPQMDGHQAARKLRSLGYTRPIVALTAHAMSEERAKCLDSGFNDFLTKPIQRDLLVDTLARYIPKNSELRH